MALCCLPARWTGHHTFFHPVTDDIPSSGVGTEAHSEKNEGGSTDLGVKQAPAPL